MSTHFRTHQSKYPPKRIWNTASPRRLTEPTQTKSFSFSCLLSFLFLLHCMNQSSDSAHGETYVLHQTYSLTRTGRIIAKFVFFFLPEILSKFCTKSTDRGQAIRGIDNSGRRGSLRIWGVLGRNGSARRRRYESSTFSSTLPAISYAVPSRFREAFSYSRDSTCCRCGVHAHPRRSQEG